MSDKNDVDNAITFSVIAAMLMIAMFLFFVAAIISFAFTLLCLWAWEKERVLFGQTITPKEAHVFVGVGVAGAMIVGLFGQWMHSNDLLSSDTTDFMPILGYVVCSLAGGYVYGVHQLEEEKRAQEAAPASRVSPAPLRVVENNEPVKPFSFASWDDEGPRH